MGWLNKLVQGRRWLIFGSFMGGALGATVMHLNEFLPTGIQDAFDLPMGLFLSTALGMVGGLIGGVIGTFICGALAKKELVVDIGESLGSGLINGFLVGTALGLLLGLLNRLQADLFMLLFLCILTGILLVFATAGYYIKKRARHGMK